MFKSYCFAPCCHAVQIKFRANSVWGYSWRAVFPTWSLCITLLRVWSLSMKIEYDSVKLTSLLNLGNFDALGFLDTGQSVKYQQLKDSRK